MATIPEFHKQVKRLIVFTIIALILSIIQVTDLLEEYELFLLLTEILALVSEATFMVLAISDGWQLRKWPSGFLMALVILSTGAYFALVCWYNGYLFRKNIADAVFVDDFSRMKLRLFEDGEYILFDEWMFGDNRYTGRFFWSGDIIKLAEPAIPGKEFIAMEMIIDRKKQRIYFKRKTDGTYDKEFYYFQID